MKLEVGKKYKTKGGKTIHLVDSREVYGGPEKRFLGVICDAVPETFWYLESGRLYHEGISPFDIESEILSKLEFNTSFQFANGKLLGKWPKEALKQFIGHKVKITVERI